MPLVTANQFRLQPDPNAFVGGIQQGMQLRGQFDQRQDKQQAQQVAQGEAERSKKLEAISFLDNAAAAIQGTPEGGRAALVNSLAGRLQEFGIDPKALGQDFSNAALANFRSSLSPFLPQAAAGKGFTLGQGQKRFDSAGNVIAEGGEKPPALTSLQKNAAALGLKPGSAEYNDFITKGATKPLVVQKAETAEKVALAKLGVKRFADVQQAADGATKLLENLDQLAAIDVESGALEPAKAALAAIVEGFGIDASGIANATNAQAFNAVSGRLVNEVLNAATGPQTDQDATRARKTIASLGDTPAALVFKNASLRAVALRQIDQRDFINERLDGGDTLRQANKEWRTFKKKTPSLSSVVKKDGLPMFFYQFKETSKQRRPGITDEEIITIWRGAHAKK